MIHKLPPLVWLRKTLLWLGVFLCLVILCFASPVGAADVSADILLPTHKIFVTTLRDRGNGSLRKAIEQANRNPDDPNEIDLSRVSGAIALNKPLPKIRGNLIIVGDGNDTIDGQGAHRIFYIEDGRVEIRHLAIANGLAQGTNGQGTAGGSAGMGGGIFVDKGNVTLTDVTVRHNRAIGGNGGRINRAVQTKSTLQSIIQSEKERYEINRGAIAGIRGISTDRGLEGITISSQGGNYRVNRGAIAGVSGIGVNGIGSIVFGGGGGFGGFGNGGNGGNGGNAGAEGGDGGNGGNGGNGGTGIFGLDTLAGVIPLSIAKIRDRNSSLSSITNASKSKQLQELDMNGIGAIAFGGGGGFGGFGNAGNGGNGANAMVKCGNGGNGGFGGNGGNGGFGGFGGGGGGGGFGGDGSHIGIIGLAGKNGLGGFGAGNGASGFGGGGGGFGGGIFMHGGTLRLRNVTFQENMAIAGEGAQPGQGKGGAIFIVTEDLKDVAVSPKLPRVTALDRLPRFDHNFASHAANSLSDNADVYGAIAID